ncbi:MAG: hypothetical protein IPH15_18145 [Comamonadaceae bacterium]|nr:hypothetical protein [Comamonadaceae bacterium]
MKSPSWRECPTENPQRPRDSRPIPPLNLKRRFAVTSLAVIVVIALGLGWLLSNMLTQRMLQREGDVTVVACRTCLTTDHSGGCFP